MTLIYINPYSFSAPWTPAQITTAMWLDASDASTVTTVSGAVSQWNDKSGNARNATQTTAANRPAYTTAGLNSLNVITFDGSNDHLVHSFSASPAPHSIYAVTRRLTGGNGNYFVLVSCISASSAFGAVMHAKIEGSANWGSYINSWTSADYSLLDTWRIVGIVSPTSTSGTELYRTDGTSVGKSYASRYAGDGTARRAIGGDPGFNTGYFSGNAGEIIVTTSALSTSDCEKMEGYLAHKWALTGSLPAGHPYKTVAPTI